MTDHLSDSEIREILQRYKKIAVIGLSPAPGRPSYGVTKYMISQGYEIFGVRPGSPGEVLGRPNVDKLSDLSEPVEIIDVFRNADAIPSVVDEVEAWMKTLPENRKPKVLWLQLGVSHSAAEEKARKMGLTVVSDRCILQEHARLIP